MASESSTGLKDNEVEYGGVIYTCQKSPIGGYVVSRPMGQTTQDVNVDSEFNYQWDSSSQTRNDMIDGGVISDTPLQYYCFIEAAKI